MQQHIHLQPMLFLERDGSGASWTRLGQTWEWEGTGHTWRWSRSDFRVLSGCPAGTFSLSQQVHVRLLNWGVMVERNEKLPSPTLHYPSYQQLMAPFLGEELD